MKKLCLALFILISLPAALFAQQTRKLIDVDYKQAGIAEVTGDLSAKTGYRFYYDPAQFDSLKVTLTLKQSPLNIVLDNAFQNTKYHYFISSDQEVILTRNWQISADLI